MSFYANISDIIVPPDRQRKAFGDELALARSIEQIGLINPIILAHDEIEKGKYILVAGERRLRATKLLKMACIEATLREDLSPFEKTLLELEENIRRKQLSWVEEVLAIHKYVELRKLPLEKAASDLSISMNSISRMVILAEALQDDPRLRDQSSWTAAYTLLQNTNSRKTAAAMEHLFSDDEESEIEFPIEALSDLPEPDSSPLPAPTILPPPRESNVAQQPLPQVVPQKASPYSAQLESFLEWAPAYSGRRFNFIHADPPYGLNMDTANLQNSSSRWNGEDGRYADSPQLFESILKAFFENQEKICAESCHALMWVAHKNYGRVASRFNHFGWAVSEVPLIWHKTDNAGIAPDPQRWPRRTYEIAVFASRGDRKTVKIRAASFGGPTTKEHHLSEKPLQMLQHFFEMIVDGTTEMLDPTCGAGTALQIAKQLGASRILGLDVVQEYVDISNRRLK